MDSAVAALDIVDFGCAVGKRLDISLSRAMDLGLVRAVLSNRMPFVGMMSAAVLALNEVLVLAVSGRVCIRES